MKRQLAIVFILACIAYGGYYFYQMPQGDVLAKVGRTSFTAEQIDQQLEQFPQEQRQLYATPENKLRLLNDMIDREALYQYAKSEGLHKNDTYQSQLHMMKQQLLIASLIQEKVDNVVTVTEDQIKTYYTDNKANFLPKEERNVGLIYVKSKAAADKIKRLLRQKQSFRSLAKKYAEDPSLKQSGGELGWFTKDMLPQEYASPIFSIRAIGRTSKVVQIQDGYYIFKLNKKRMTKKVVFEDAIDQIREELKNQQRQELLTALIDASKKGIKIVKDVSKLGGS